MAATDLQIYLTYKLPVPRYYLCKESYHHWLWRSLLLQLCLPPAERSRLPPQLVQLKGNEGSCAKLPVWAAVPEFRRSNLQHPLALVLGLGPISYSSCLVPHGDRQLLPLGCWEDRQILCICRAFVSFWSTSSLWHHVRHVLASP